MNAPQMKIERAWTDLPPLATEGVSFSPVIHLPNEYEVYDFTAGYDSGRFRAGEYGVGRYAERRPNMYSSDHFERGARDIHVGIDIAAPVDEPVHAFYAGTVFLLGDNTLPQDYGPTLITRHTWLDQTVYALHGHLKRNVLADWNPGDTFDAGTELARVGSEDENGGWNPHLHFQLSLIEPWTHDLPGVVGEVDLAPALSAFPDPRLVLGPIY